MKKISALLLSLSMLLAQLGNYGAVSNIAVSANDNNFQNGILSSDSLNANLKDKIKIAESTFEDGHVTFIKDTIANHFAETINFEVADECVVAGDATRSVPTTYVWRSPIEIYLTAQDDSYWSKVVFQLSHEMTHYLAHENDPTEAGYVSWIEETICEANVPLLFGLFRAELGKV